MNLFILRYVISNDFDEGEHAETAKGIQDEFKDNAIRVLPATWLIKSNDTLVIINQKVVKIINDAKVNDKDYKYILTSTSKAAIRGKLRHEVINWLRNV